MKNHSVILAGQGMTSGMTFQVDLIRHFEGTPLAPFVDKMSMAVADEELIDLSLLSNIGSAIDLNEHPASTHHERSFIDKFVDTTSDFLDSDFFKLAKNAMSLVGPALAKTLI